MSQHSADSQSRLASARSNQSGQSGRSAVSLSIKLPGAPTVSQDDLKEDGINASGSVQQSAPTASVSGRKSHVSNGTVAPAGTPTKVTLDNKLE